MKKYLTIICCLWLFISCPSAYAISATSLFTDPSQITKTTLDNKIVGVDGPALKNAATRLDILKNAAGKDLTEDEIQTLYKEGPAAIKAAMMPYGYTNPQVTANLTRMGTHWTATYQVTPGPQIIVTAVDVKITGMGQNNPALTQLLNNLPIKIGLPFNADDYSNTKKQLLNTALELGYLDAKFMMHQVQINRTTRQAQEQLLLDTGPQYYFGGVHFSPSPLQDKFLQRYVPFKSGEKYTAAKLLQLQQNLTASGYFAEIQVRPDRQHTMNQAVPINVILTMKKKIQYSIGAGYGTDTGPRGTLGLNLRWLNDTGQNFKALITGSEIQNSISAKYIIPGKDPLKQQYYVSASVGQETPPNNSTGYLQKVSTGYSTIVDGWTQDISLNAQHENYSIEGAPFQESVLFYPQATWSRNNYDNILFPLHGGNVNFSVLGTATEIGSTSTFAQGELKGQYVYSLTAANRFVARGDIGYTVIKNLNSLPLSLQFFAGGAQSIRAYQYQGLGPGRTLAVGSLEYQREIYNKWYAAIFYDAGNAANHVFHCTSEDIANGVNCGIKNSPGIGAMWASPVGPLELDVAQAIDESGKWYKNVQISFSMGANV